MTGHELRKARGKMGQVVFTDLLGVQHSLISTWDLEEKPIHKYIE